MDLAHVFHGYVSEDGTKLVFLDAEKPRRQGVLKRLAGLPVVVTVKRYRKRRSDRQNRWHWGVAVPILAQELGYDKHDHERLHYALVAKCFGTTWDTVLKQEVPNQRSSALTTAQFSELMEWEIRFAASELGIVIPLPNEVDA